MTKRFWGIGISVLLVLALSLSAFGQGGESAVKGNLAGAILDSTGAVVPGAKVTIDGPTGTKTLTSEADGRFAAPLLIPGLYSLKVEKQGFRTATVKSVDVAVGKTSTVSITLQPGAVSEVVEVSAAAVTVDTTSTAVGTNLGDSFYQNIPVGRGVQNLFYVAPGAVSSGESQYNPSISGGSALDNLYVADGVSINDQAYGGIGVVSALYGTVGTGINLTFIKEVQIKSGGFEPQYGNAGGGIVQIVTKSGSQQFHGGVGAYFAPSAFQATYVQRDDFRPNKVGAFYGGDNYDASGELGGYVPGLKSRLYFFGSINPTWQKDYWTAPPAAGIYNNGHIYDARKNVFNYDAKLTFKINDSNQLESSFFADPSHTGTFRPNEPTPQGSGTYNLLNDTGYSKWNFGTKNLVARYNGTMSPTWLVNASFTWNNNVFEEIPSQDVFQVTNQTEIAGLPGQRGQFTQQGFGLLQNHTGNTYGWTVDTQKVARFAGEHTLSVGFNNQRPDYDQTKHRSGGRFDVPTTNAAGVNLFTCTPGPACPLGHTVDAQWNLKLAPGVNLANNVLTSSCTLCPLFPVNGNGGVVMAPVYLQQIRGEFGAGGVISTNSNYLAAYANDSWTLNPHVTLNLGLRWDQQHIAGTDVQYTFNDSWSPRLGISIDPKGDRKTKISANFGRYSYGLPLDAAVRSLSSELDLQALAVAPVVSGSSISIVPDAAHVLNNMAATGGVSTKPTINLAGGQAAGYFIVPGTRWSYEDEYVAGAEHEFKGGIIVSARYINRSLHRIIEDMSGTSPELALAGASVPSFIGNPSPTLDATANEKSVAYADPNNDGAITGTPTFVTPPASCGGATAAFVLAPAKDGNGNNFLPGQSLCWQPISAGYGGEAVPDGTPDGFVSPIRRYQAVEIEVNKQFSHNWMLRSNWTISRLSGNYQGNFRGDNGQRDPGISSLFDFTAGAYNLLGEQFTAGVLPTDRLNVVNGYLSYVFDKTMFKGLTLGTGIRVQSGQPISSLGDHPVYQNNGEVPTGGRGALGRTPVSGQVDVHAEYPWKVTEKSTLSFIGDFFNIANSRPLTVMDQSNALSGQPVGSNTGYLIGTQWQRPFYARFGVKWSF